MNVCYDLAKASSVRSWPFCFQHVGGEWLVVNDVVFARSSYRFILLMAVLLVAGINLSFHRIVVKALLIEAEGMFTPAFRAMSEPFFNQPRQMINMEQTTASHKQTTVSY